MKVIRNDNSIYFDVDDTLICWGKTKYAKKPIRFGVNGYTVTAYVHEKHVQSIKNSMARGHYVVVWSQGGHEWAEMVVKALGLTDYVNEVRAKPKWIYDDLDPSEWMPRPFYYK